QQTLLSASYTYGLRYFVDRVSRKTDSSHEFSGRLDHQFSERHKVSIDNSFAYAQEAEVVSDIGVVQRSNGSAYRNFLNIDWNSQISEVLGINAAYGNNWYDYTDSGNGTRSALLDRLEHEARLAAVYQVQPKLKFRGGYRLSLVDYAGKFAVQPPAITTADVKNQLRHTVFVGTDYEINSRVRASFEGGPQFTDYSNLDGQNENSIYVSGSLVWVYRQDSYARVGVRVDRTATDLVDVTTPTNPTTDAQSMGPYLDISHKLTPRITLGSQFRYNHYEYKGGANEGLTQNYYSLQLNADYKINEFLSANLSYNYDKSTSPSAALSASRDFDRNRIFLGLTAKY
ncbi:MAG: hypothetical protein FJ405_03750, partial [Verrucomicrobia bacterium]|nr:hypothetical protein [Verrucomicrobiota bacterium]